jgi:hypothetical protein
VLGGDRCVEVDLSWLQFLGELAGALGVLGGGVAGGVGAVVCAAALAHGVMGCVK